MFFEILHTVTALVVVNNLASCLWHLVIFLSNQEYLGSCGLRYPSLRYKHFRDWTDSEIQYIVLRLLKDTMLVGAFIIQHSLMATDAWKKLMRRLNINVSERLLYVLASCFVLTTLMQKWKSTPDVYLWSIDTSESRFWWLFILVHAVAWMIIFIELMIMDPGELIGLKQIYFYHTRKSAPLSYKSKELQLFYKHFRHPGPLGIWLMLWVHPVMTLDRLVLAVSWSLYIFIAYSVSLNGFKFAKSYFQVQRSRSVYYRPT